MSDPVMDASPAQANGGAARSRRSSRRPRRQEAPTRLGLRRGGMALVVSARSELVHGVTSISKLWVRPKAGPAAATAGPTRGVSRIQSWFK